MECHSCSHMADVSAGVYSEVPWEETPCAVCVARGNFSDVPGRLHVEYHDGIAPPEVPDPNLSLVPVMPVAVLADALSTLLRLPLNVLEVVRLRYLGVKYCEIARRLGMSRSACTMMVVRALGGHPVLAELLPRTKVRREARGGGKAGKNRKAGRRVPAVQPRVVVLVNQASGRKRT